MCDLVLKLSGEASGSRGRGFEKNKIEVLLEEIRALSTHCERGLLVVIGGGNLVRHRDLEEQLQLTKSLVLHQAGMLATVMNAMIIDAKLWPEPEDPTCLRRTKVMSTIPVGVMAETWDPVAADRWLKKKSHRVLFVAGGTGFPGVASTDTAALMFAIQLRAPLVLKATKVDGVYSRDPLVHSTTERFSKITATEFLSLGIDQILDPVAVTMARQGGIEIRVFKLEEGSCEKAMRGKIGTLVSPE